MLGLLITRNKDLATILAVVSWANLAQAAHGMGQAESLKKPAVVTNSGVSNSSKPNSKSLLLKSRRSGDNSGKNKNISHKAPKNSVLYIEGNAKPEKIAQTDPSDILDSPEIKLRDPIDLKKTKKPEEANDSVKPVDKLVQPDKTVEAKPDKAKTDSTLAPMGVIRFDVKRDKRRDLKGGLSIFRCLDEALVKSPRASAIRSYLPITKAMFARATEQPSPEFFFDEGVRAEQTRRMGAVFNWEPPWKLVFRLLVAKQSVGAKRLDLMSQLWQLRAEVRRAYTEVVVAQETLETLTSLYDLAHRLRVVSEKRFSAGDVPELDLLKARLAESRYEVEKLVGLRRVIRAKQQLNIIMGRAAEAAISIPRLPPFLKTKEMKNALEEKNPLLPDFSRPMPKLDHYINKALKNRYELKTIDQELVLNKAKLRQAYGDIAPTPQVWIGQSAAGNPPIGPKLNAYYVGVSVPTQITEFQQGNIAEFKAQKRQLGYQFGAQKNVITAEVSSAYNNVLAARQWLKVYEDHVLADSYEVARLARRSYEVGQADITSTIQAQQYNVEIRSLYLQAISLYQQAFTELEMACGMPLLEEE